MTVPPPICVVDELDAGETLFRVSSAAVGELPLYFGRRTGERELCGIESKSGYDKYILVQSSDCKVIGIIAHASMFRRAWMSSDAEELFHEIIGTFRRSGHKSVNADTSGTFPSRITNSMIRGRWRAFRAVSKKSVKRSEGIATSGSVLERTLQDVDAGLSNYSTWIASLEVPGRVERLLEFGAGTGTIAGRVAHRVTKELWLVEPSERGRESLLNLKAENIRIGVVSELGEIPLGIQFDLILLSNVLEHIENDVEIVARLSHLLTHTGRLVVFSPAHNFLYSRFDQLIGHIRRYTQPSLRRVIELAGLEIETLRYVNPFGAVLWLMSNRLARTVRPNQILASVYDKIVVPTSRVFDLIPKQPFGQSVIAVARLRDGSGD